MAKSIPECIANFYPLFYSFLTILIFYKEKNKLTLANNVLPVPGGPYMSKFLNKPLFDFVLRVETAISLKRSSRDGFFSK